MKILILAPYPIDNAPSQRFRFEHFLPNLDEHQIEWSFQSFISEEGWKILYEKGNLIGKAKAIAAGILRRCTLVYKALPYDRILIHRELAPFGPPLFEWLLAKVLRKKIIYDFDDAIWIADQGSENPIWKLLKWRSKVGKICKWSWKVSVGNEYLGKFARENGGNIVLLPTVVNTDIHKPMKKSTDREMPVIGWTGSHSTLFYLDAILPILKELEQTIDFEFMVIANKNPELPLRHFRFVKWSKETEVEALTQMDLGIMPLEDNEWAKGKCGFKLIQYLSIGIPAIASPVGVNDQIIIPGKTGFLATSADEWKSGIRALLENKETCRSMGETGRKLIEDKFSVKSQKQTFLDLFHGDS